jgi:hypothetical protein
MNALTEDKHIALLGCVDFVVVVQPLAATDNHSHHCILYSDNLYTTTTPMPEPHSSTTTNLLHYFFV